MEERKFSYRNCKAAEKKIQPKCLIFRHDPRRDAEKEKVSSALGLVIWLLQLLRKTKYAEGF